MNWLERLKKLESTPAATLQNQQKSPFAGFVGAGPALSQKTEERDVAWMEALLHSANDAAPPADISLARLALFTDRGLSLDDAQALADKLTERDRGPDDRRLCLECQHLSGWVNSRRCSQWRKIGIGSAAIPGELVSILQRCAGFKHRLKEMT